MQQSVSEVEPVCVPFVPTRLQYRPALDGVRAFAVLAVIGYHLGYRWLRGGFVGVDVFFVLSGYLITTLLVLEYQRTARIDIPNFWLRRAKRLLPALFILIVAVWCWEVAEAPRFELPQRGQDLIWTLFYGSNWHFISSGQDYFAQFTSASPVRHTWSLAIEEQFYLAWPPIVLLILMRRAKTGSRLALVCAVGILASALAMAWLFAPDDPSRAYYGTDTRAHQLLIGALLAVLALSPRLQRATRLAAYASLLGAAVLLTAMIRLSDHDPRYWNGWSLALAVAAASLIWGLELNSVGPLARLLAWRPLVWIGQISYGLYLWHWPVIVAVKTGFRPLDIFPRSTGLNLTRLALTFGVATASFYLVEQPVKQGRVWWIASSRFRLAAAAIVATALVAGVVATTGIDATVVEDIPGCPSGTYRPCLRVQAPRSAAVVAVIGDSLARSLDPAFAALARENGWTYILGATNGCRISHLLTSSAGLSKAVNQQCYDQTPELERLVLASQPFLIVAIDRWEIMDVMTADGRILKSGTAEHLAQTERAIKDAALTLTSGGARLVFIGLPPILSADCGRPGAASSLPCRVPASPDPTQAPYNAILRRLSVTVPHVSMIWITDALCPNGVCTWDVDGVTPRFDGLHFAPAGNALVAPILFRDLRADGLLPQ